MLPVTRSELAQADYDEIVTRLEERNARAADRFASAFRDRCRLLGQFPLMGRSREDLAPGLRSVVVGNYVVFYCVLQDCVSIARIVHGSRDLDSIMKSNGR